MKFQYSFSPLITIISKLMPVYDYLKILLSGANVVIHGSNYTTNVGDRAIALTIKNELKKKRIRSVITSRFAINPPVRTVIVGGGGVLHNNYENNIKLRTSFIKRKRNVFYVGVGSSGFSKLSSGDKERLNKLRYSKYLSFRDVCSFEKLAAQLYSKPPNVKIRSCPSWLLLENIKSQDYSLRNNVFRSYYNLKYLASSKQTKQADQKPNLGLVLCGHFDLQRLPAIRQKIKQLQNDYHIINIPFVGEDLEFFKKHIANWNIDSFPLQNPGKTFQLVQKMDKMIVTRYHSLIFSILAEKPVMILAYSEKVRCLAKDLKLNYYDLLGNTEENMIFNHFGPGLSESKKKAARLQMQELFAGLEKSTNPDNKASSLVESTFK